MITLVVQNQIWMLAIDSKLAFLLKEKACWTTYQAIIYKPIELESMKIFGGKKE